VRYVAVIAFVDWLLIALALSFVLGAFSLPLAAVVAAFGAPLAIVIGIPMLWVSRRLAPGSFVILVILGAVAGALSPMLASWLLFPLDDLFSILGVGLGVISASLWWWFVERFPERREHYA
jgi:hypothetical protein